MSGDDGLSDGERLAVWLAVHAPELREPYALAHRLLDRDDGNPVAVALDTLDRRLGMVDAILHSWREAGPVHPQTGELWRMVRAAVDQDAAPC